MIVFVIAAAVIGQGIISAGGEQLAGRAVNLRRGNFADGDLIIIVPRPEASGKILPAEINERTVALQRVNVAHHEFIAAGAALITAVFLCGAEHDPSVLHTVGGGAQT